MASSNFPAILRHPIVPKPLATITPSSSELATVSTSSTVGAGTSSSHEVALKKLRVVNKLTANFIASVKPSFSTAQQAEALQKALSFSDQALEHMGDTPASLLHETQAAWRLRTAIFYQLAENQWQEAKTVNGTGSNQEIQLLRDLAKRLEDTLPMATRYVHSKSDEKLLTSARDLRMQAYISLSYALSLKADQMESVLSPNRCKLLILEEGQQDLLPVRREAVDKLYTAIGYTEHLTAVKRTDMQVQLRRNLWSCQGKYSDLLREATSETVSAPENDFGILIGKMLPLLVAQPSSSLELALGHFTLGSKKIEKSETFTVQEASPLAAVDHFVAVTNGLLNAYVASIELNEAQLKTCDAIIKTKKASAKIAPTLPEFAADAIPLLRHRIVSDAIYYHYHRVALIFARLSAAKILNRLTSAEKVMDAWLSRYVDWFRLSTGSIRLIIQNSGGRFYLEEQDRREFMSSMLLTFDDRCEQCESLMPMLTETSPFYEDLKALQHGIAQIREKLKAELSFQASESRDAKVVSGKSKVGNKLVKLVIAQTEYDGKLVGERSGNLLKVTDTDGKKVEYRLDRESALWQRYEPNRFVELSEGEDDDVAIAALTESRLLRKLETAESEFFDECRRLEDEAKRMTDCAYFGYRDIKHDSQSISALVQIFELGTNAEKAIQELASKVEKRMARIPKKTEAVRKKGEDFLKAAQGVVVASQQRIELREATHFEKVTSMQCNGTLRHLIESGKITGAELTIKRKELNGVMQVLNNKTVKLPDFLDEIIASLVNSNQTLCVHVHYRSKNALVSQSTAQHLIVHDEADEKFRPPLSHDTTHALYQLCS